MPRTIRAAPGKPAGRFGNGYHLWVAARGRVLPAGLHVSRRRADGWDVDDNNAFQPSGLIRISTSFDSVTSALRPDASRP